MRKDSLFKETTISKIKDIRKVFLWVAVWILIGELVLGAILIISGSWSEVIGKIQSTFLCVALAMFVGVNNFIRMEKGTKAAQGLALASLIANVVWAVLATLLIWEVVSPFWYETSYRSGRYYYENTSAIGGLSVSFKLMIIAVCVATAGFWISNVMAIKENVKPVKPLKITAIVCQSYCCIYCALAAIIGLQAFVGDAGRWWALMGLADVAFFITAIAAWIVSKTSDKEKTPATDTIEGSSASSTAPRKTDDELRAEIEEQVRREMIEKEVRAKVESESSNQDNGNAKSTPSEDSKIAE